MDIQGDEPIGRAVARSTGADVLARLASHERGRSPAEPGREGEVMAEAEMPRKRRRWSRWVVLVLALLIVTGAALFGHRWLRRRRWLPYVRGQMLLVDGRPAEAMHELRKALERDPTNTDAFSLLVESLASLNDYDAAQAEIGNAAQFGISKHQSGVLEAHLLFMKAKHRLQTAGKHDLALCDSVLEAELRPAISLLEEHAEGADDPGRAYDLLGDVRILTQQVLADKEDRVEERRGLALNLDNPEEAASRARQMEGLRGEASTNIKEALAAYERAIELAPDLDEPRLTLAGLAVAQWVPDTARVEALLAPLLKKEPGHLLARLTLASAERRVGRYPEATAHLDAIEKGADDARLLLVRTRILVDQEQWAEALPLARRLAEREPNIPRAMLFQAKLLYATALHRLGDSAEAAAMLQPLASALEQSGASWPELNCILCEALLATGNLEQARAAFRRADRRDVKAQVSDFRALLDLVKALCDARLALARNADLGAKYPAEAAEEAAQVLALKPGERELFDLAMATEARASEAALAAATQAVEKAEGRTEDRAVRLARATEQLEATKKEHLTATEDLVLRHASGLLREGDLQSALEFCEEQLQDAPGPEWGPRVRLVKARMLARAGSFREAIAAYEDVRQGSSDLQPALELAALQLGIGHVAEARALYEEIVSNHPANTRALAGLVAVMVRQGDLGEARSLLAGAEREVGSEAVQGFLMELALKEGRMDEAAELAKSLAAASPDEPRLAIILAHVMWEAGRLDEARQAFDDALAKWPDDVPAYRRGLLDLQQDRPADAIELYKQAQEKLPAAAQPAVTVNLALALQADGQVAEAAEQLTELTEDERVGRAHGSLLHWFVAVLAASQGDLAAASEANGRINQIELGSPQERQALLRRLVALPATRRQQAAVALNKMVAFNGAMCVRAALEEVERLAELFPEEPLTECWRGAALDRQGRHEEAVAIYEKAIEAHPDLLSAYRLLANSHAGAGDADAAAATLEGALQHAQPRQAAAMQLRLGELRQTLGQTELAIAAYQAAADEPALAPAALNNMAYLIVNEQGVAQGALVLAQRALALGGERPETLDTLGWIHLQIGDIAQALSYLERAKSGLPGMPAVRYHLGMAYLQAGDLEKARAELQEALTISPTFPEAQQARAALAGISP